TCTPPRPRRRPAASRSPRVSPVTRPSPGHPCHPVLPRHLQPWLPVPDRRRYRQMGAANHGAPHGPASGVEGTDARWLSAALALILAFMAGEVVAGVAA